MGQKIITEVLTKFEADVSNIKTAVGDIQREFAKIKPSPGFEKGFLNTLSSLENEISLILKF